MAPLIRPPCAAQGLLLHQCSIERIQCELRPCEIVFGGLLIEKRVARSFINTLAIQRINGIPIAAFGHGSKIIIDQHTVFKAGAGCAVVEGPV